MRSAEYDAFGPWILPVTATREIPPLFRDHAVDFATSHLVLKFPRDIARRDANPSMDLYEHLVIVDDRTMTVLSRRPDGYGVRMVAVDTICAIDYGTDLLDGWFTVHSSTDGPQRGGSALRLGYVGTSQDVIEELVRTLRSSYRPVTADAAGRRGGVSAARPVLAQRDLGDADIALVTRQLALLRAEPGMRLLGFHRRRLLAARDGGPLRALVRLALPTVLHAGVVLGDGRELLVVHRRDWVTRGRHPEHSLACTVLPLARVDTATVGDDPRNADVHMIALHCGTAVVEIVAPAGSPTERALIEQLGGRMARQPAAA